MFHALIFAGDVDTVNPMFPLLPPRTLITEYGLTHFNAFSSTPDGRSFAEWHNALQRVAAEHPLAIPVTLSTDPRHHFTDNPLTSMHGGAVLAVARAARAGRDRVGGARARVRRHRPPGVPRGRAPRRAAPADRPGDRASVVPGSARRSARTPSSPRGSPPPTSAASRPKSLGPDSVVDDDQALPRRRPAEGRRRPALRLGSRAGLPGRQLRVPPRDRSGRRSRRAPRR